LSVVQEYGVRLLDQIEQWEKGSQKHENIRLAMIAGNQREAEEMFPEFFKEPTGTGPTVVDLEAQAAADAFVADPEAAIDFTEVVWTPTTEEAYEEMVRLMTEAADEEEASGAGEPEVEQDREWV
jgi:hypothetical protein